MGFRKAASALRERADLLLEAFRRAPVETVVLGSLLALSVRAVWLYLRVTFGRIGYPYDLEWMEGGMVAHVGRLLDGKSIYVEPTLDFVPFIYNPLFYVFGAVVSAILGTGPVALRIVAFSASVGVGVLLALLVSRGTRNVWAGVAAAGLFYATYELSGAWMDIARVDSTFLFFSLAAVHRAGSARRFAIAETAGLVAVAFLAKQYAVLIAAPIALYFWCARGLRAAALFSLLSASLTGGAVLLLNLTSDGWYWFWAFRVPAAHGVFGEPVLDFAREQLWKPAPVLSLVGMVGAALLAMRIAAKTRSEGFRGAAEPILLLGTAGVLLVEARYSWDHPGRFFNCLMPAHLALALLSGVALGLSRRVMMPRFAQVPRLAHLLLSCVLAFALYRLGYPPRRYIPTTADRRADAELERQLRESQGKFVLPFRAYFGGDDVNQPHAHQMALWDLFTARLGDYERRIRRDAERRFAKGRVTRILLDEEDYVFFPELTRHFKKVSEEALYDRPGTTRTGAPMRSRYLYERKRR